MDGSALTARPRTSTRRKRFLLAFLALVLGLVLAETALVVYARATQRERGLLFDPLIGWRMRPHLVKTGSGWSARSPARTNSHGWRDDEIEFTKPAGRKRVVALGDSFTFGAGVDQGERWTEELERQIPALDVVNLGMNAIGPDQELLVLESDGLRYGPNVVICALYEANDFDDVGLLRNGYRPKPWFRLQDGELELVPPPRTFDVVLRENSYLGEGLYRLFQRFTTNRTSVPDGEAAEPTELVHALLARMRARSEEAGARFLVLFVCDREQLDRELAPREAALRASLSAAGIELLETRAAFAGARDGPRLFLPDEHWSPAAHVLAGRLIAARLIDLGWL